MARFDRAPRVLLLGAHPDDAEIFAGGLLFRLKQSGATLRLISVTDGRSGHHSVLPNDLVPRRRQEAANAGEVLGAEYLTWDFPDGYLQPTISVREAIIAEMRRFQPDLVLTHRTCDYHPDHRSVGQAVQDASYLVTVPHIVPNVPRLEKDPLVAYMPDLFTRPAPLSPDVVLDITDTVDSVVKMLACHGSQVFEWLPYHDDLISEIPPDSEGRLSWLGRWLRRFIGPREKRWATRIQELGMALSSPNEPRYFEAFELSEYAGRATSEKLAWLFPGARF